MKYVLNRKTTFSSCAIGKKEGSQKVSHYRAGGPSGDFQVEEERIIWQFYYFLAGCLCTSISLSSNLCEAITVPLCSGVLLIVGSYNLSPLTKQKGGYTTHFPPMRDEFESLLTSLSTRESDSCYRMFVLTYLLYTISTAAVKYNL